MAVYTHITAEELSMVLDSFNLGPLIGFEGIAQGVENSNFVAETRMPDGARLRLIITIFEKRVAEQDIPFFLAAMAHCNAHGLPTPRPFKSDTGGSIFRLRGKPSIATTFLEGAPRMTPTPADCAAVGAALAKMHIAGEAFPEIRPNDLSISGWRDLAASCKSSATATPDVLSAMIDQEIEYLSQTWPRQLPAGLVHADAFPDNVFFDDVGKVSGIIDFYFSCTDFFAYDLAIALNAWSSTKAHDERTAWSDDNAAAMLTGYQRVRPLSGPELAALPTLLRGAALRFLLTRLYDFLNQAADALVVVKDPYEYARLLETHRRRRAI
ncbi:MAG: homoserine kinase [Alphaproteobacteria bacterium]|nr:homoserine kinase [Alphaproteobacteria bacterium]